jgi:hypothetical protein
MDKIKITLSILLGISFIVFYNVWLIGRDKVLFDAYPSPQEIYE